MTREAVTRERTADALRVRIQEALAAPHSDATVRSAIEALTLDEAAKYLWFWGPVVYARNPRLFRPVILARSRAWFLDPETNQYREQSWHGESGRAFAEWLAVVDKADDILVFKLLYRHKLASLDWKQQTTQFQTDLSQRWERAADGASRATVLRKMQLGQPVTEAIAIALYTRDPAAAKPFILAHLPSRWQEEGKVLWRQLFKIAEHDDALCWPLYRHQIPITEWAKDVAALARSVQPDAALDAELEKRHPGNRSSEPPRSARLGSYNPC
jgi:hypothetical protein